MRKAVDELPNFLRPLAGFLEDPSNLRYNNFAADGMIYYDKL